MRTTFVLATIVCLLLEIPSVATLTNEWLIRATYPGLTVRREGAEDPEERRRQAILINLNALRGLCGRAEQTLGALLGPITGTSE